MEDFVHALGVVDGISSLKPRAVLFYLLHNPNVNHRNEMLADIFWSPPTRAKLMASWRRTKKTIGDQISHTDLKLESGRGTLQLPFPSASLDAALNDALQDGQSLEVLRALILQYVQEFDLLLNVSKSFDSWLSIRKTQVLHNIGRVLESRFEGNPLSEKAFEAASLSIELEPSNEPAARHLMFHFASNKTPNRALEIYNQLYACLDTEFDQDPEPATVALLADIKTGQFEDSSTLAVRGDATPRPKLVVCKKQEAPLSADHQSLLFVLFSDFRMRLARFREWTVLDETAHQEADIVITMQLLCMGDTTHLLMEVSDPGTRRLLWSETFDDPAQSWDEKARVQMASIASALSVAITANQKPDANMRVYDDWLQSQMMIDLWSPETENDAIDLLSKITRSAPRFGAAHAELAGAINVRHVLLPGTIQSEKEKQRALHHALEAISIDPMDTRAHRVLAWCYCHKSEFELAEFHFDQSLYLNKSNSLTMASCALGYAFLGRLDLAEDLADQIAKAPKAMEPFHLVYLAAVYYLCGHPAKVVDLCTQSGDIMSTVGGWHSSALVQLGQMDQACERMAGYVRFIRGQWAPEGEPNMADVGDWFVSCFPLKDEAVRERLRETVFQAISHIPSPVV